MSIKNFLQKFPIHTITFIPLLSIFLYAHNIAYIEFFMLKRTIVWGILATIILLVLFYFLFHKNIVKSAVYTSIFFILFFNYGVIYDYLELWYYSGYWPFKNIHRYLTFFYLLIFASTYIYILKSERKFLSINYALNIIVLILFTWNVILLFLKLQNQPNSHLTNYTVTSNINQDYISQTKPDVYFIVLDGYANQHVLSKYYNYDNSKFLKYLKNNGFQVLDSCRSNYYSTLLSLSSILNYKYFTDKEISNSHEIINQLRNNIVFNEFKKNGYKILQLKSGYSVTSFFNLSDSIIPIEAPNEFERAILRYSMFRLDDIFGQIPYLRLKSQFNLFTNWKIDENEPTFNFIHIVCPHPPYVFNSKGKRLFKSNFTDNSWEPKENYLEQLIFVNSQVQKFINNIQNQYSLLGIKKDPIIIFLSDHGPYLSSNNIDDFFEIRSKIFYAVKGPDLKSIPDFATSVNTFPFIFNTYFNCNINYSKDSLAGEANFKNSELVKKMVN